MVSELFLTLSKASGADDGSFRMDQSDMRLMGVLPHDVLAITGERTTYARVVPAFMEERNQRIVCVPPVLLGNIGFEYGQKVKISSERHVPRVAESVALRTEDDFDALYVSARMGALASAWNGRIVTSGDRLKVPVSGKRGLLVEVSVFPASGPSIISPNTDVSVEWPAQGKNLPLLGGLREIHKTCRGLVMRRFSRADGFSVGSALLTGAKGCGKASLVERLASECGVDFVRIDIEEHLCERFEDGKKEIELDPSFISRKGDAIILFDNLDALSRCVPGSAMEDAAMALRCQFLKFADELSLYPNIMFFGVDSSCSLDAACRERFRISLDVEVPDKAGRHEILKVCARDFVFDEAVDLNRIAGTSVGMTARDLKNLIASAAAISESGIVADEDVLRAAKYVHASKAGDLVCEVPDISLNDLAGFEGVGKAAGDALAWALFPEPRFFSAGVEPGKSVLISGGKGSGKTSFARAVAAGVPAPVIEISCSRLAFCDAEETKSAIRGCFSLARRRAPCVVFFDDIDDIFDGDKEYGLAASLLLSEIDDIAFSNGVAFMAASCRPDKIHSDLLKTGRVDFVIDLPAPDASARKKIMQINLQGVPIAADMDFDNLSKITENMSAGEIAGICKKVALLAVRRSINSRESVVSPPLANAEMFEQIMLKSSARNPL